MGWLFKEGCSRKNSSQTDVRHGSDEGPDGTLVESDCLAHCYRGGVFSGILWSVWERTSTRDGQQAEPTQRWIVCDLMRFQRDYGWGYGHGGIHAPVFSGTSFKYLDLVPIDKFGGHAEWRELAGGCRARITEKRRVRKATRCR